MATIRNVRLLGYNELLAKLDYNVLVQPEIAASIDTFTARMERGGKGLGAKNNIVTATTLPLGAEVQTTLRNPRQTGKAWAKKNLRIVRAMAPRVLRKALERIGARWAK